MYQSFLNSKTKKYMTHVKFTRQPFENGFNNIMEDLFTEFPVVLKNEFNKLSPKAWAPVNVKETDKAFELEVVAPGFVKEDFKINLEDNLLTISAEKKDEVKTDSDSYRNEKQIRNEYSFKSFKRTFTIDEKLDATKTDASYINGVLRLNFPKKVEVKTATEIKIQ